MSLQLRFEIMGQVQLSRTFDRISLGVSNLRKPFGLIAKDFYHAQRATFDAEGAHEGKQKWQKLNPRYRAWKAKKYSGAKVLVLTGVLKRAATTPSAKGSVFKLGGRRLEMGVDLMVGGWNLAALHQFGTSKLPAREVIRLSSAQKLRWVRIIRDYFHSIIKR